MSELIIATLVLQGITLLATCGSPIVTGIGFAISHIKKSTCCFGSGIEFREASFNTEKLLNKNFNKKPEDSPVEKI